MKTIATAAVLMMLTAPTWADDLETRRTNDPANTNEPIVLTEMEMDNVTAGIAHLLPAIQKVRDYPASTDGTYIDFKLNNVYVSSWN